MRHPQPTKQAAALWDMLAAAPGKAIQHFMIVCSGWLGRRTW
jgi:hypothetical protein